MFSKAKSLNYEGWLFLSWLATISFIVSYFTNVIFNDIAVICLILVPVVLFMLNEEFIPAVFLFLFLMYRFIYFPFTRTTPFSAYYALFIVILAFVKTLLRRDTVVTLRVSKSVLKCSLLICFICYYDGILLFLEPGFGKHLGYAFSDYIILHVLRLIFLYAAYYMYKSSLEIKTAKRSELYNFASIVFSEISYFAFLIRSVPFGAREVVASAVLGLQTLAYTRVDPNFYSFRVILMALLFLRNRKMYLVIVLTILIAMNIAFLVSVSGLLLSLMVLLYGLLQRARKYLHYAPVILIFLVFAFILLSMVAFYKYELIIPASTPGFLSGNIMNFILTGRPRTWNAHLMLIRDHPFGVGSDVAWLVVSKYLGFNHYAHNIYIQIISEYGLIAGMTIITFVLTLFGKVHKFKTTNEGLFLGYTTFLLFGLFFSLHEELFYLVGASLSYLDVVRKHATTQWHTDRNVRHVTPLKTSQTSHTN